MASKQRARAPKKERAPNPLVDLGMFGIPDLDALGEVEDSDDGDVESELEAIIPCKATGRARMRKAAHPKKKAVAPSKESPKVPSTDISPRNEEAAEPQWLTLLRMRKQKYKVAAVQAKQDGDKTSALQYMKTIKTIDALIEKNQLVDMSMIPPSPPQSPALQRKAPTPYSSKKEHGEIQASSVEAAALSAASGPEDPTLFAAPPPPKTILEALQQRLENLAATQSAAEAEGNVSKSRRLQRIVKSYEEVIKDYKAGQPVDFEELPTPPGFAPIPTGPAASKSVSLVPPRKSEGSKAPGESVVGPPKRQTPTVPSKGVQPQKHKDRLFDGSVGNRLEEKEFIDTSLIFQTSYPSFNLTKPKSPETSERSRLWSNGNNTPKHNTKGQHSTTPVLTPNLAPTASDVQATPDVKNESVEAPATGFDNQGRRHRNYWKAGTHVCDINDSLRDLLKTQRTAWKGFFVRKILDNLKSCVKNNGFYLLNEEQARAFSRHSIPIGNISYFDCYFSNHKYIIAEGEEFKEPKILRLKKN